MVRYALIPSPFVGAQSWGGLTGRLAGAVAVDYGGAQGPDWYDGIARRVVRQVDDAPWVAVLHSGAGGYAPALAEHAERLAGFVFLDAVLPYPGRSCLATAPAPLVERLRALTTGGRLAPWNLWFDEDPTPAMIRSGSEREAFVAALPCTPFAFLEAVAPDQRAWEDLPKAYVQLSKGYAATADKASAQGWPVARAKLHHLAMFSHPDEVADLIRRLDVAWAP